MAAPAVLIAAVRNGSRSATPKPSADPAQPNGGVRGRVVRAIVLALMAAALMAGLALNSLAAGVRPLIIDVDANPGDTKDFTLTLTPGEKPEKVNLSLYQATQTPDGSLTYDKADPKAFEASSWVKLPDAVNVSPGNESDVTGTVKVPFSAGGSYVVIIMVEPDFEQKATGITFRMRYAVRLNVRVAKPGVRAAAEVESFGITKGKTGEPSIEAVVKNLSPVDYMTSAEVTIRNAAKQLVERFDLKPEVGWSSNLAETRMYPLSTLRYFGNPTGALFPGTYDLRLFYRFASGMQITKAQTITVKDGDFTYPAFKLKALRATPQALDFEGKPGALQSKAVKFENKGTTPVHLSLQLADVQSSYAFSALANSGLEIKGATDMTLAPGRIATVVLSTKVPRDAKVQGNYAMLIASSLAADGKSVTEELTVPVSATVPGTFVRTAIPETVAAERVGDAYSFTVAVVNTGNIAVTPTGTLLLKDGEGKLAGTVKLDADLPAGQTVSDPLLPLRRQSLSGQLTGTLPKAGAYTAEIKLTEGTAALGSGTLAIDLQ